MVCGAILEDGKLLFYLRRDSQSDIIDYIVAHFMIEGMGVMRFYDKGLKAYVVIKEEDGNSILYIKGTRYPVQISSEALKQYPDWQRMLFSFWQGVFTGKAGLTSWQRLL